MRCCIVLIRNSLNASPQTFQPHHTAVRDPLAAEAAVPLRPEPRHPGCEMMRGAGDRGWGRLHSRGSGKGGFACFVHPQNCWLSSQGLGLHQSELSRVHAGEGRAGEGRRPRPGGCPRGQLAVCRDPHRQPGPPWSVAHGRGSGHRPAAQREARVAPTSAHTCASPSVLAHTLVTPQHL